MPVGLCQIASATLSESLRVFLPLSYPVRGQLLWTDQTPGPPVQQDVCHLQEGVLGYFAKCPATCSLTFSYDLRSSPKPSPLPN